MSQASYPSISCVIKFIACKDEIKSMSSKQDRAVSEWLARQCTVQTPLAWAVQVYTLPE